MEDKILLEAYAIKEELAHWRTDLHRIPELGLELPQTCAYIAQKLDAFGISYRYEKEGSYIIATVGQGEPCFLLRADMDALPVEERSGEPFASTNGCMHACGHDMHATGLLGAAKLLKKHEAELKGTVKLLFQSGEETFSGALEALKGGLLENPKVDAAYAMHVFATAPCGVVVYGKEALSSVYGFRIKIKGKGSHGSSPDEGIDPIHIAVAIFEALEEIKAREIPGTAQASLTIGKFSAGTVSNVIPDSAELEGTLRTFDKEVQENVIRRITELSQGIAAAYRGSAEVETLSLCPPVVCDEAVIEEAKKSVRSLSDKLVIMEMMHSMASEDFSFVSEKVPTAYFGFGAGVEDQSRWRAQHNPEVVFNMDALPLASAIYAKVAMDYLENHKTG